MVRPKELQRLLVWRLPRDVGFPQVSAAIRAPFDLEDIQIGPSDGHDIRLYPTAKRVRAFFGDIAMADSTRVQLMLESGRLPVYYFPVEDVRMDLLVPGTRRETSPTKGQATYLTIDAGRNTAPNAAWRYEASPAGCPDLSGLIALRWRAMDAWYEEDEQVIAHAQDRKSTRLNSSHLVISYAVFCLKKKKKYPYQRMGCSSSALTRPSSKLKVTTYIVAILGYTKRTCIVTYIKSSGRQSLTLYQSTA